MKSKLVLIAAAALLSSAMASAADGTFDPSRYSQEPTGCDLLAAHPDDPYKVAPGISQSKIDLPAAIGACEAAVKRDPQNPRLRYQLGRVYGYSGQGERAKPHRELSLATGYPQALFVYGYLHLNGENEATKDVCKAEALLRRSAQAGRFAGLVGYPMWALEGRFNSCPHAPDAIEMMKFLRTADEQTSDFYKESLIALLQADLRAWKPAK